MDPYMNPYGSPGEPDMTEFSETMGEPLAEGVTIATEEQMVEAMRTVFDPEIPVNIYDLGLIYTCDITADGTVSVEMSLTAPGCPVAGEMPGMVASALAPLEGTGEVTVKIVWDPAWSPDLMSEDAKLALGMF